MTFLGLLVFAILGKTSAWSLFGFGLAVDTVREKAQIHS